MVIRCIEAICDNGQLLVDIFVNYDCDLEGANLFERLVLAMVRIAQGSQDKEVQAAAGPEETALRLTVCYHSLNMASSYNCLAQYPPYVADVIVRTKRCSCMSCMLVTLLKKQNEGGED